MNSSKLPECGLLWSFLFSFSCNKIFLPASVAFAKSRLHSSEKLSFLKNSWLLDVAEISLKRKRIREVELLTEILCPLHVGWLVSCATRPRMMTKSKSGTQVKRQWQQSKHHRLNRLRWNPIAISGATKRVYIDFLLFPSKYLQRFPFSPTNRF